VRHVKLIYCILSLVSQVVYLCFKIVGDSGAGIPINPVGVVILGRFIC